MAAEVGFLRGQLAGDASLANSLTLLELPNFLAALEHLAASEPPERVVDLAASSEGLVSLLNRPRAVARIVEIRSAAARKLPEWSHARYVAEDAAIGRLMEQGRRAEAVRAAQALHLKCETAGEAAYEGAAYDGAVAQKTLGRALQESGNAEAALPHLEQARQRFERLNRTRMAGVALAEKANCLMDVGRYDEAVGAYRQVIATMQQAGDARSVASGKGQLATLRLLQGNFSEALRLNTEAREVFERLKEPAMVAVAWHQIGSVYEQAEQYDLAEQAYERSLSIEIQRGNRVGQASTLNQLGSLYSKMGRSEDAVRLYRKTAEIYVISADQRSEGFVRSNLAGGLFKLGRFDEARAEIERAVECDKPFGHVAEPWKTFDVLSDLERAVGNQSAAAAARQKALSAYLAYRRDGGAPQIDVSAIPPDLDPADPEVNYAVAAEILLALGESASAS
jgi:tetratricopeptide (TPR) repeat protein